MFNKYIKEINRLKKIIKLLDSNYSNKFIHISKIELNISDLQNWDVTSNIKVYKSLY